MEGGAGAEVKKKKTWTIGKDGVNLERRLRGSPVEQRLKWVEKQQRCGRLRSPVFTTELVPAEISRGVGRGVRDFSRKDHGADSVASAIRLVL